MEYQIIQKRRQETGIPLIMGILNVTPDSFSDGGLHDSVDRAIEHAGRMIAEGADIIDVGGESTRPPGKDYGSGSAEVSTEEELERVIPVIRGVHEAYPDIAISVDTVKPVVAEQSLDAGATIINDVSGGSFDRAIWDLAAERSIPYILMDGHNPNRRIATDQLPADREIVETVFGNLMRGAEEAGRVGVEKIIIDPGIGFAKRWEESIRLIQHLDRFVASPYPVLLGASRKSFIGRILGGLPVEERLFGSLAAAVAGTEAGVGIVRVHDVAPTFQLLNVLKRLSPDRESED